MKTSKYFYFFVLFTLFACAGAEIEEEIATDLDKDIIYLDDNGVTIKASSRSKKGDTKEINGITYTVVDLDSLKKLIQINADLSKVVVSKITNMSLLFQYKTDFNQNLSNWDVSNVTSMDNMFRATSFNSDISYWDVSKVTNMNAMFRDTPFNQDISTWNVSNVTFMGELFRNTPFNNDISSWNVSNVENMGGMFRGSPFNQDISNWDVSSVTKMPEMFRDSDFNQNINSWKVDNVDNMGGLFRDSKFNQPLNSWNMSNVITMAAMFKNSSFNQNVENWNVSKVKDMTDVFQDCVSFNQNISNWDVSQVTIIDGMIDRTAISPENYDAILLQWSSLNLNKDLNFGAREVTYCNEESSRQKITTNFNWIISDGGLDCN